MPDEMREIAKEIGVFEFKGKKIHPIALLNASLKNADIFEKRVADKYPQAYETYLQAKEELYKIQAKTLLISTLLALNDIERVREELHKGPKIYFENVIDLGDKLAYIGQENAAIVFEKTQPELSGCRSELAREKTNPPFPPLKKGGSPNRQPKVPLF